MKEQRSEGAKEQSTRHVLWSLTNLLCRLLLAVVFIFSGFVKAVDPKGTQYKLQDYLTAWGLPDLLPDWATLTAATTMAAAEFCLGIFMLFAIRRRLTTRLVLAFMVVMTPLTLWLAITNPISDCGCFGDAVTLTNWQTFLKNVILLAAAVIVARNPLRMKRFIPKGLQWVIIHVTLLFILATAAYSLYYLPPLDFRPYHVGADIRKGMEIPPGAPQPQFETTFILEKDGIQKEFTLDNYPDSTWTFVDSKTIQTAEGYVPPIHDFSVVERNTEQDITDSLLNDKGYTFLLVAPYLEKADDACFGEINQLYDYAQDNGFGFYALTASDDKAVSHWTDITGADYPFCTTDATTLKTIVRSNPGLLLLRQGVILGKWSHHNLPDTTQIGQIARNRLHPVHKKPIK